MTADGILTLSELNRNIKSAVEREFPMPLWVTGEISSVTEHSSGHCYLELVEKEHEKLKAVVRAVIWSSSYRMIKTYFVETTGRRLERGMHIMVCAEVSFSEIYGLSLIIRDINPDFTLGNMERMKREAIARLKREGVFDMNRSLEMPVLPKTIAVISSPTAAGWGDFENQLMHNSRGYGFHLKLFPALMQGERTAASVIAALDRIAAWEEVFDLAVIIRGGGAKADLSCFDTYELANNVAQFPLPVVVGIGHERDSSVVDEVARMSLKTPTAVASYLLDVFSGEELKIKNRISALQTGAVESLVSAGKEMTALMERLKSGNAAGVAAFKLRLQSVSGQLKYGIKNYVREYRRIFEMRTTALRNANSVNGIKEENKICLLSSRLKTGIKRNLAYGKSVVDMMDTKIKYSDPRTIMGRGYSIARVSGKVVKKTSDVKPGDTLETILPDGNIISKICNYGKTVEL